MSDWLDTWWHLESAYWQVFAELNEALRDLWHTILDALTTKPEQ